MKNKRLGEMLVDAGILSEKQIEEAIALQKDSGKRLGTILLENHFINETQLIEVLRIQLGIDFIDLNKTKIDPYMAGVVSKAIAQQYRVVAFRKEKNVILLAMEDPLNFRALETVKQTTKCKVRPYIAYSEAIDRAISVLYENEGASIAIAQMEAEKGSEMTVEDLVQKKEQDQSSSAPTVKLVNSILERGIAEKASDIHIEPRENDVLVRIRVDGRLNRILTIPKSLQESVISRLKVMSEMNITEHRVPQDGRAQYVRQGKEIDLRLNCLPTIYGEKIVVRILTREKSSLNRKGIVCDVFSICDYFICGNTNQSGITYDCFPDTR